LHEGTWTLATAPSISEENSSPGSPTCWRRGTFRSCSSPAMVSRASTAGSITCRSSRSRCNGKCCRGSSSPPRAASPRKSPSGDMGPAVSVAPHQPVSRNRTAGPSAPLPRVWACVRRDDALARSLALIIAAIESGRPDALLRRRAKLRDMAARVHRRLDLRQRAGHRCDEEERAQEAASRYASDGDLIHGCTLIFECLATSGIAAEVPGFLC